MDFIMLLGLLGSIASIIGVSFVVKEYYRNKRFSGNVLKEICERELRHFGNKKIDELKFELNNVERKMFMDYSNYLEYSSVDKVEKERLVKYLLEMKDFNIAEYSEYTFKHALQIKRRKFYLSLLHKLGINDNQISGLDLSLKISSKVNILSSKLVSEKYLEDFLLDLEEEQTTHDKDTSKWFLSTKILVGSVISKVFSLWLNLVDRIRGVLTNLIN